MAYVDYAAEAKNHRRDVARCYYQSRKDARQAAKEYANVKLYRRNRDFLVRHPELTVNEPDAVASYDRLILTTISLADTLLNSAFTSHERARFYAQLARDYDELADRVSERRARLNV